MRFRPKTRGNRGGRREESGKFGKGADGSTRPCSIVPQLAIGSGIEFRLGQTSASATITPAHEQRRLDRDKPLAAGSRWGVRAAARDRRRAPWQRGVSRPRFQTRTIARTYAIDETAPTTGENDVHQREQVRGPAPSGKTDRNAKHDVQIAGHHNQPRRRTHRFKEIVDDAAHVPIRTPTAAPDTVAAVAPRPARAQANSRPEQARG